MCSCQNNHKGNVFHDQVDAKKSAISIPDPPTLKEHKPPQILAKLNKCDFCLKCFLCLSLALNECPIKHYSLQQTNKYTVENEICGGGGGASSDPSLATPPV